MELNMKTLAVMSALVIGLGGAPRVYAHGTGGSQGSMMDQGMMENHDAQKPNSPSPGQGATQ